MEWWLALLLILGILFLLFASGTQVAFAFLVVNFLGVLLFWGGQAGLSQLARSIYGSLSSFTLLPLVLFVLMGSILFQSGMAVKTIDALDKWMGRLPGRLGLLALGGGVLVATLSGASMASSAILASTLTPEMERRGYKKAMSLGPIMGSGGLAIMIPPSSLAVLIAALAETSVADVLIGGLVPGLMMGFLYGGYIILRCWLHPSVAPPYDVESIPFSEKIMLAVKYVLPLGAVVFMVTGVILLGIATPSEAAATGALASLILAACYKKLSFQVIKNVLVETSSISVMIFMIISGAVAFGQILGFSGATAGLTKMLIGLELSPIVIVIILQIVLIMLGMFAGDVPMLMVIIPLFIPIIHAFGMSPVWFCLLLLLNVEMAATTPPYGLIIFVMKGMAPETDIMEIYRAGLPFLLCDAVVMALMLAFPALVLYLPSLMH
jgi:tripartite ATP-independent transporter DctM subunit